MKLEDLPLDLLLALQDAMTDPTPEGKERAALRAADAGFYLIHGEKADTPDPIEDAVTDMVEAEDKPAPGEPAVYLKFNAAR